MKYEFAAEAEGWKVVDFLEPPTSVENWRPTSSSTAEGGHGPVAGDNATSLLRPGHDDRRYHPTFVFAGTQFANTQTQQAVAATPPCRRFTSRRSGGHWRRPRRTLDRRARHHHAQVRQGRHHRLDDEEGAEAWTLWAKSASACGANLTVTCVLNKAAATTNWSAGAFKRRRQIGAVQREPPALPVFAILQ